MPFASKERPAPVFETELPLILHNSAKTAPATFPGSNLHFNRLQQCPLVVVEITGDFDWLMATEDWDQMFAWLINGIRSQIGEDAYS